MGGEPQTSVERPDLRASQAAPGEPPTKASGYAYYALFLLIVTNAFNYVDRNILSILAQSVKQDLGLTDAQLGFLLGTAFAVLYSVTGIAIGRIADALSRTVVLTVGLTVWSAMTALSGFAVNFATLAAARICVGVGEATSNPCSHSLVCDYFPPRNRSAALGAYLISTYLGGAASLVIGALLLRTWPTLCEVFPGDACRLPAWRAAFLAVGLPGLILAVLIAFLRSPPRAAPASAQTPLRVILQEASAALPPFILFNLRQVGGWRAVATNLVLAAGVLIVAAGLSLATGDWAQWVALALGAYSVLSWRQIIKMRDRPLHDRTFGSATFMLVMIGGALTACFTASVLTWSAPYAIRTLHSPAEQVGLYLGAASAVAAGASVVLGGFVADHWKRRDIRAPIWIGVIAVLAPIPFLALMLLAKDLPSFLAAYVGFSLTGMSWAGAFAALAQDLVLPRMRATTSSLFSLVMVLISAGLGPYWAGKISTLTGSLAIGLMSLVVLAPVATALLLMAAKRLPGEMAALRAAEGPA